MFHRTSEIIDFLYTRRTTLSLCFLTAQWWENKHSLHLLPLKFRYNYTSFSNHLWSQAGGGLHIWTLHWWQHAAFLHCGSANPFQQPFQADHIICTVPKLHLMPAGLGCTYFPHRPCSSVRIRDYIWSLAMNRVCGCGTWVCMKHRAQRHTHCGHRKRLRKPSRYIYIYVKQHNKYTAQPTSKIHESLCVL